MDSYDIGFYRKDVLPDYIEGFAMEFAEHFKSKRDYFIQFCGLLQYSKRWTIDNLEEKLPLWCDRFLNPGRKKIVDLVIRAFRRCESDEHMEKLRGTIVESLLIASFGGSKVLQKTTNYGWGARVYINQKIGISEEIKYKCPNVNHDSCKDRSTVDFVYWNGRHGEFYECKAQPKWIECKEIKYMEELQRKLHYNKISHEIFFVCLSDKEAIRQQLENAGCGPLFKALGARELFNKIA